MGAKKFTDELVSQVCHMLYAEGDPDWKTVADKFKLTIRQVKYCAYSRGGNPYKNKVQHALPITIPIDMREVYYVLCYFLRKSYVKQRSL